MNKMLRNEEVTATIFAMVLNVSFAFVGSRTGDTEFQIRLTPRLYLLYNASALRRYSSFERKKTRSLSQW